MEDHIIEQLEKQELGSDFANSYPSLQVPTPLEPFLPASAAFPYLFMIVTHIEIH
jgi:hypothetical protein